jgi:hypothetical protein
MAKHQIAVEYVDGRRELVTIGRPADLIAFADKFEKVAPDTSGPYLVREAAWLVHRALRVDEPFEEWIETLEGLEFSSPELEALEAAERELTPDPTETETTEDESTEAEVVELIPMGTAPREGWPFLREHRRIETLTGSESLG